MALLDSEIARIKAELGYPLLSNSAEPFVGIVAIFEQVIQPYLTGGASTTSSTAVSAQSEATPIALTVADATGFAALDRVLIDVDDRREQATIQSISGTTVTLMLRKKHSGTYPVFVEGGESIIRETLSRIAEVKEKLLKNYGAGALKQVDEISFYAAGDGATLFGVLGENLRFWRNELSALLGVPNMWSVKQASNGRLAVY